MRIEGGGTTSIQRSESVSEAGSSGSEGVRDVGSAEGATGASGDSGSSSGTSSASPQPRADVRTAQDALRGANLEEDRLRRFLTAPIAQSGPSIADLPSLGQTAGWANIEAATTWGLSEVLGSDAGAIVGGTATDILQGQAPLTALGSSLAEPLLAEVRGEVTDLLGPELGAGVNRLLGDAAGPLITSGLESLTASLGVQGPVVSALGAASGPLVAAGLIGPPSISAVEGLLEGRDLTLDEQLAWALPTFGVSLLANPISDLFGSGKDEDQQKRDVLRGRLQDAGFIDDDYGVSLADGSTFDIGRESFRYPGTDRDQNIYELEWDREITPETVGLTDALSAAVVGGDEFYLGHFSMMLAHAALSNAGDDVSAMQDNVRQFATDLGFDRSRLTAQLARRFQRGEIGQDRLRAGLNAVRTLFGAAADD